MHPESHSSRIALYIHYPFCVKRCPYCGFATRVDDRDLAQEYRQALMKELAIRAAEPVWAGKPLLSIFFGGGTPSLMPPEFMVELLEKVDEAGWKSDKQETSGRMPKPRGIEITLEANPTTRDFERFAAFRQAGCNRISIGAQSFQPQELAYLGRWHAPSDIADAARIARDAGFDNLSLDLIYGVPGQTVASFTDSVHKALALGIDHLSAYTLTIETGTPFEQRVRSGRMPHPDSDLMADQYAALVEIMRTADFDHYELTNYARDGKWSRHNYAYWDRTPYLGLGLGSHSFDGRRRFWNTRDLQAYLVALQSGNLPEESSEIIDKSRELEERLYLALRSNRGLEHQRLSEMRIERTVEDLLSAELLFEVNGKLHIPEDKWLLLDEIVLRLIPKENPPALAKSAAM